MAGGLSLKKEKWLFSELDLLDLRLQRGAGDFVCRHDAGTLLEGVGFGGFDIFT